MLFRYEQLRHFMSKNLLSRLSTLLNMSFFSQKLPNSRISSKKTPIFFKVSFYLSPSSPIPNIIILISANLIMSSMQSPSIKSFWLIRFFHYLNLLSMFSMLSTILPSPSSKLLLAFSENIFTRSMTLLSWEFRFLSKFLSLW